MREKCDASEEILYKAFCFLLADELFERLERTHVTNSLVKDLLSYRLDAFSVKRRIYEICGCGICSAVEAGIGAGIDKTLRKSIVPEIVSPMQKAFNVAHVHLYTYHAVSLARAIQLSVAETV